jgi:hypothetical protein
MFCVMIAAAFWYAALPHSMQMVLTLENETTKLFQIVSSLEKHGLGLNIAKTQSHCV